MRYEAACPFWSSAASRCPFPPPATLRIRPDPLSSGAVAAPAAPLGRDAARVFELTSGNPLLVIELLDEPVQRAVLQSIEPFRQADGSYRIPNAFRFTRAIR